MNQLYTGINPGGILADLYLMRTYFIIKTNYFFIGSKFTYKHMETKLYLLQTSGLRLGGKADR